MSTSVIEIESLEDLFTSNTPPCEMYPPPDYTKVCGKSSAYRIRRKCKCGMSSVRFICKPCYHELQGGRVGCYNCLAIVAEWKLM